MTPEPSGQPNILRERANFRRSGCGCEGPPWEQEQAAVMVGKRRLSRLGRCWAFQRGHRALEQQAAVNVVGR
jgi:hypothetical protein